MARGVRGRVRVIVELEEFDDGGVGAGERPRRLMHSIDYEREFTAGTTDGTQLDRIYSSRPALTTTPTDHDLASISSLPSALDASLNVGMSDCALIVAQNRSTSGDVQIGAGTNPFTGMLASGDVASVKPDGILVWVAPSGAAVSGGSADILRAVASTGTVNATLLVAGRTV